MRRDVTYFCTLLLGLVGLGAMFGSGEALSAPNLNCGYQLSSDVAEMSCSIESDDPATDSTTYSSLGVSVYAFSAPTWSVYPSGWTDAPVGFKAFQRGSGICSGGAYQFIGVQFRATYVAGGGHLSLFGPQSSPPIFVNPLECN